MTQSITHGATLYTTLTQLPVGSVWTGGNAPTNRNEAVESLNKYWGLKPGKRAQFEWDAMMWHGAVTKPGVASIGTFLKKLFSVLLGGGLMYNDSDDGYDWKTFDSSRIPLASALSHGGRVIIQLPVRTQNTNRAQDFFDWLTDEVRQDNRLIVRSAATHALAERAPGLLVTNNSKIRVTEKRGKATGLRGFFKGIAENNHFGVNVPMGGYGNTNPFSGNRVQPNGDHGHVYMYFNPKNVGQCGGMMVGCENSAPGSTSQTFVVHDWRAVSESYSPAGTMKWPEMEVGPKPKAEAMFVDLSDGWEYLRGYADNFEARFLNWTPHDPLQMSFTPRDAVIFALTDLLEGGTILPKQKKQALTASLTSLLNDEAFSRTALRAIMTSIGEGIGLKNITISNTGVLNASNLGAVTQPIDAFNALQTCNQAWPNAAI